MTDNEHRLKWDKNIRSNDTYLVKEYPLPDGVKRVLLTRSATNPVGPISARDFVTAGEMIAYNDGRIRTAGMTAIDDVRFPQAYEFVRGVNFPGGWVYTALEENVTEIKYMIHSDIKGWFPSFVVNNAIGGNYVTFFESLLKAMSAAGL
jgi:hypothetical protein